MKLQLSEPSASSDEATLSTTPASRTGRSGWPILVLSGALSAAGTSSAEPNRLWEAPYVHEQEATASGSSWAETIDGGIEQQGESTGQAVAELRLISGLTWEQLGHMFGVSRRSVHFWASGKPLNADNETRLLQVLDIVRRADRGDARSTRAALLDVQDGHSAVDLLAEGQLKEARLRLGAGSQRAVQARGELDAEARAARAPLRPEELVDARHDRVHRNPGGARAARTVRNRRRGTS